MRIVSALFCMICANYALADGFEARVSLPQQLSIDDERERLTARLPMLEDPNSRSAIERYRLELDRYNQVVIQGFLQKIQGICIALNASEREVNQLAARGDITSDYRREVLDYIASERTNCSDQYAETSPYFALYYALLAIYREGNADSERRLSACNSDDGCRAR